MRVLVFKVPTVFMVPIVAQERPLDSLLAHRNVPAILSYNPFLVGKHQRHQRFCADEPFG